MLMKISARILWHPNPNKVHYLFILRITQIHTIVQFLLAFSYFYYNKMFYKLHYFNVIGTVSKQFYIQSVQLLSL